MLKKTIMFVLTALLSATAWAADKFETVVNGMNIRVEFYTESIVRVTKTPVGENFDRQSMVVIAQLSEVGVTLKGNSISSNTLTVRVDPKTGNVSFASRKDGMMLKEKSACFEQRTEGPDAGAYRVTQVFTLDKDEAIYGLGTIQDGRLNRRGTHKLMEQSNQEDFQNVLQSIKGWGLYWDNYSRTQFDDDANGMSLSSEVGKAIDYYFIFGGSADGVVAGMRHLSGSVPMFPLWTYGYWQSKERYKSSRELLSVVDRYRELHVPLDGIIQDWQYWGNNYLWNAMEFLNEDFADGERMVRKVHEKNAHLMISIWASFGPKTKPYRQLDEKGLLYDFETWPQSGLSPWPPRMDYPSGVRVYNAFSKDARDIYWQNLKRLYDSGIDAWWMDSTDPDFFKHDDSDYDQQAGTAETWRALRNAFPLATVGGVYDNQRRESSDKRVFIMTRSAFAGQQRYGSNMWSGDVGSSWDMLRKQVPAGLNFTLTGNPNFNTDIGGFFCGAYNTNGSESAPRNLQYQELYVRWMQYGFFCPVFRSHGTDAPREIWQFGEKGTPIYDAIESCIRLRYRFLPYLYSMAWQVTSNNESYMRPLMSDFRADKHTWDIADEFLFGRSILAVPVLEAQYTGEKIQKGSEALNMDKGGEAVEAIDFRAEKTAVKYLPKGARWFDFWTNKIYNGGQNVTFTTSIDRVPMFVKAGSILVLAPEMEYVGQQNWDNLEVRVYPGADAEFTIYEDEGDGYNYEKGHFSTITLRWNDRQHSLTIENRKGEYAGMLQKRHFKVLLPNGTERKVEYVGTEIRLTL